MSAKTEIGNVRLYLFWSLLKIPRFFSITENCKQKIWLKQPKAASALDFSYFEKVPIFEPGNSGFKNGNFSFILGSRKELRFVLNRSFHVQLSMRSVTVVKFDILF